MKQDTVIYIGDIFVKPERYILGRKLFWNNKYDGSLWIRYIKVVFT